MSRGGPESFSVSSQKVNNLHHFQDQRHTDTKCILNPTNSKPQRQMSADAKEKTRIAGFNLWVTKSKIQHGNRYDYMSSSTEFVTQKSPEVTIRCIEHSEIFSVFPFNHLRFKSGGCRRCDEEKAHAYFLQRERQKFYEFFELNLADRLTIGSEFQGMTQEMTFYCKLHKKSSAHKPTFLMNNSGYGCLDCANDSTRNSNRLRIENVISEFEGELPDNVKILCIEVDEKTKFSKVRINCEIHGEHLTTKGYLKRSQFKCPKCGDESVGYAGHRLKALIDANQKGRPTYIGVMEVEVFGIKSLKIGVTTRTLQERYKWNLKKIHFSVQIDEIDAYILENRIHRVFKKNHDLRILMAGMRNGDRWSGDTECYWHEKLDELIRFIKDYINNTQTVAYEDELQLYETPNFFTRDVSREKDETNKPIAVVGVHPDTLEVVVEFNSISDAYKAGYQNVSSIVSATSGRQISHGLRWFKKSTFNLNDVVQPKNSNRGNPKTVVCLDTGEEFDSISIAEQTLRARGVKISGSHISSVCKGKRKIAGGLKWEFKNGS